MAGRSAKARQPLQLLGVLLILVPMPLAASSDEAEFFGGNPVELVVGYPTGGSNDIYSRVLAKYLSPNIPGRPNVVVRNMPGAGSLAAANYMFNTAPKDGSVLAAVSAGIPLEAKLGNAQARFQPSKFNWIGRIAPSTSVTMVWNTSRIRTIDDARQNNVVLSATGAGSTGSLYPAVMNELLKTRFRLISGYQGTNAGMLAMERGEVEGHSTTWEAVKSVHPDWLTTGQVRILVQHGLKRDSELPSTPTSLELTKNPEDREVMRTIMGASEIGKSYFTAPGVPKGRVEALRRAFDRTMSDAGFLAAIASVKGVVEPLRGEEVQTLVEELDQISAGAFARTKAVYTRKLAP